MKLSEHVEQLEAENERLTKTLEQVEAVLRLFYDGEVTESEPKPYAPDDHQDAEVTDFHNPHHAGERELPKTHGAKIVVTEWKGLSNNFPLTLSEPIEVRYSENSESWNTENGEAFPDGLHYALPTEITGWRPA